MKQILLLLLLLLASPALAGGNIPVFTGGTFAPANLMEPLPQSGKEKLLISFYRNSGRTPDFKRWSYQTKAALEAPDYDRSVVALNEQVRLQTQFQNTDPTDYVVIHAPLDVSRYSSTQETLFLPVFSASQGLQQEIYGEKMSIIVHDLKRFQTLAMNNNQASVFFNSLSKKGERATTQPVFAELVLKPTRTIFSKEGRAGKGDSYLFFLDLAQITLWTEDTASQERKALWMWKADWYKAKDDNADLLQLYKAIN